MRPDVEVRQHMELTGGVGETMHLKTADQINRVNQLVRRKIRHDWLPYVLDFEGLSNRLQTVRLQFGLKRALSSRSISGETRSFAEILDREVEKIVMFYITQQGKIAESLWHQRELMFGKLKNNELSPIEIEKGCNQLRLCGQTALDLLEYLNANVIFLRRILKNHDKYFNLRMSSLYFDARIGTGSNQRSQLLQLYHQEGLRAIIEALHRGFEDLYDARQKLFPLNELSKLVPNTQEPRRTIAASKSFSSLHSLLQTNRSTLSVSLEPADENSQPSGILSSTTVSPRANSTYLSRVRSFNLLSAITDANDDMQLLTLSHQVDPIGQRITQVDVSTAEPILQKLLIAADCVLEVQQQTTEEYRVYHSTMGPWLTMSDVVRNQAEEEEDQDGEDDVDLEDGPNGEHVALGAKRSLEGEHLLTSKETSMLQSKTVTRSPSLGSFKLTGARKPTKMDNIVFRGLILNLFLCFLYQANQYVVAPTSGLYASRLGMSPALAAAIIGAAPLSALLSAIVYSAWSNTTYKLPLVVSLLCLMVGNLMYAAALQFDSVKLLFLGRLITGLGGPRGIIRRYIADHVPRNERNKASSWFVSSGALGLAFGPLISALMSILQVNFSFYLNVYSKSRPVILFEEVTAPGWIMGGLYLICLVLVVFLFSDPIPLGRKYFNEDGIVIGSDKNGSGNYVLPVSRKQQSLCAQIVIVFRSLVWVMVATYSGCLRFAVNVRFYCCWMCGRQMVPAQNPNSYRSGGYGSVPSSQEQDQAITYELVASERSQWESIEALPSNTGNSLSDVRQLSSSENIARNRRARSISEDFGQFDEISTTNYDSKDSIFSTTSTPDRNSAVSFQELAREREFLRSNSISELSTKFRLLKSSWRSNFDWFCINCCGLKRTFGKTCFLFHVSREVTIVLLLYFINKVGQEIVVSSVPNISSTLFRWNAQENGFFMTVLGLVVLPSSTIVNLLSRKTEDRYVMWIMSCGCLACVMVLVQYFFLPYDVFQYCLGAMMLFSALNALEGVIMALLSKLMSPRLAIGTFNSGLLSTEAGTIGRVVGDALISYFAGLSSVHQQPVELINYLYIPFGFSVFVTLGLIAMYYDVLEA